MKCDKCQTCIGILLIAWAAVCILCRFPLMTSSGQFPSGFGIPQLPHALKLTCVSHQRVVPLENAVHAARVLCARFEVVIPAMAWGLFYTRNSKGHQKQKA